MPRLKRKKYLTLFLIFFVSIVWATGQISDSLHLDGKEYSILSVRGRLLYPSDFGIKASPPHTANVHGYYSEYRIENGKLFLSKITINSKDSKYPSINGVEADLDENKACYKHPKKNIDFCTTDGGVYKNVNKLTPLTGKLLLGRDFIKERYCSGIVNLAT